MVIDPLRAPLVVGLKVTLIVQVAPELTVEPQVLVWAKSPLAAMLVMLSEALPLLVSVTDCAALVVPITWLEKVNMETDRLTTGAIPVPLSATVWVLPATPLLLSVTVSAPLLFPSAIGVNVTLIVQDPPAARDALHVLV